MKVFSLLPLLGLITPLASAQEIPPHHPQFNNVPVLEPRKQSAPPVAGALVIEGGALKAVEDFMRQKNGYGTAAVWKKLGVEVKQGGRVWKLAPSIYADGVLRESASIDKDPANVLAYAQRAAAWHGAILVVDGAARQDNTSHIDVGAWRDVYDFPNGNLVDADLAEVFKQPLTGETFSAVLLARRVKDYTPLANGQRTPEVLKLDEALALYAKVRPTSAQATMQRGVVLGKVAIFAIGSKDASAKTWSDSFVATSKAILERTEGRGILAFFLPAIENLTGTPDGDLAAQVLTAEAKNPGLATDVEMEIARTLMAAKLPDAARQWAAFAVKSGAETTPRLQWVQALTAPEGSDAQYEWLKKCAFLLAPGDQDKVKALGMLAEQAGKRGDKAWELRALEEQIMCGGPANLWTTYAQKAREAGEYGNAWNANRIALVWQSGSTGVSIASSLFATQTKEPTTGPDALPANHLDPSRKILMRLEGAFLLAKLGESAAARGEYDALTGDKPDKTALILYRRFLRDELKKTPGNADLKYGFEKLNAVLG